MSLVHVPNYSHAYSHGGLLANVAGALRAVANALFAAKPVAVKAAAVKEADRDELFRLARECESFSPSLAAELNFIARQ